MEPCVMCLSAALAFRVKCIVYGAIDKRLGAIETYIRLLDVVEHPYHTVESVVGGIRGEECGNLVRDFFRERRVEEKERRRLQQQQREEEE
eukprot:10262062-Ditylum_brightwellii.AAC.1